MSFVSNLNSKFSAIQAKVNALPTDPADQSDLASLIEAIKSVVDDIKTYTDTEVAAISDKLGTIADVAGTDTIVALLKAIKAKTDTIV